jgi:hypothetical protein
MNLVSTELFDGQTYVVFDEGGGEKVCLNILILLQISDHQNPRFIYLDDSSPAKYRALLAMVDECRNAFSPFPLLLRRK